MKTCRVIIWVMGSVAALMVGIPESVPAVTVNRVCISGMEAVVSGAAMIKAGYADVILAGGMSIAVALEMLQENLTLTVREKTLYITSPCLNGFIGKRNSGLSAMIGKGGVGLASAGEYRKWRRTLLSAIRPSPFSECFFPSTR